MTRRFTTRDELRSISEHLTTALARIVADGQELIRRAEIPTEPDGFPPRTSGANAGTASAERPTITPYPLSTRGSWGWRCSCGVNAVAYPNELEATIAGDTHRLFEHGDRPIDYTDPVGDAVVLRSLANTPDPIADIGTRFMRHIRSAERAVNRAVAELDAAKPGRISTAAADEGWCVSCARDGGYREPAAAGRYAKHCRFCGEFNASNGCEPPMPILRARHEGRRISAPFVDAELAKIRRKRKAS